MSEQDFLVLGPGGQALTLREGLPLTLPFACTIVGFAHYRDDEGVLCARVIIKAESGKYACPAPDQEPEVFHSLEIGSSNALLTFRNTYWKS